MRLLLLLGIALMALSGADFPQAEISNGQVKAKVYLPDAQRGYYQATRFDWSGVIASLQYQGHNYFGVWFPKYDPKINDAITGPVEEFLTNGAGLGYDEVAAGENFVKIGVGAIRKPQEARFQQYKTYEIADTGKWSVRSGAGWIEFTQELGDTSGYSYVYQKTLRLANDKPQLAIEHSLRNTGRKTIETSVYEHNFYMIDGLPTGPDVSVKFPFEARATRDMRGLAETRGKELVFLKELAPGQSAFTDVEGYGTTASDYDIRVENRKAGAGVRQTCDRPMSRLVFWSIRTTPCPEAYVQMKIEPGKEFTWRITYDFYTF